MTHVTSLDSRLQHVAYAPRCRVASCYGRGRTRGFGNAFESRLKNTCLQGNRARLRRYHEAGTQLDSNASCANWNDAVAYKKPRGHARCGLVQITLRSHAHMPSHDFASMSCTRDMATKGRILSWHACNTLPQICQSKIECMILCCKLIPGNMIHCFGVVVA